MGLNTRLVEAAKVLSEGIAMTGGTARTSLGGEGTAFGWTGGLVPTIADYATPATADGMTFKATIVSDTGTPAAVVAKNASKPTGTQIASSTVSLKKFAGQGAFALEDSLDAVGLAAAIGSVLGKQCLKAFETDAIAALSAGAGTTIGATTDWVQAAANAQAVLLGNGAKPSVLVIPAAVYGAFIADVIATNAFSQDPESPVGALLGTVIHVSSTAPATHAYMFDSSAVMAVQHSQSPLVIVDCLTGAGTNTAKIILDLVAAAFVASSAGVVKIPASTLMTAEAPSKSRK